MEQEITHISVQEVIEDPDAPFTITSERICDFTYIACVFLLLIIYLFNDEIYFPIIVIVGIIQIIALFWSFYEYRQVEHRNLGFIKIYHDRLIVEGEEIRYELIKDLEFRIADFRGHRVDSSILTPVPNLSQGVDNFIRFFQNDKLITLQFQLRSKPELERLEKYLLDLYLNGAPINQDSVFGLVYGDLRYAGIQELKKQRAEKIKEKQRLAQQDV